MKIALAALCVLATTRLATTRTFAGPLPWASVENVASRSALDVGPEGAFVTGLNQAWLGHHYGSQWTRNFDEAEFRRLLSETSQMGGSVLRVWLFEGLTPDGLIWDDDPEKSRWGYPGRRHKVTAITPDKLHHLEKVLEIASGQKVLIYLTLFDGNIVSQDDSQRDHRRAEWWNLLNDRFSAGRAFRENVLVPVLDVVSRHRETIYGIDLVNEINAFVGANWFDRGWDSAREFLDRWRPFIRTKARVPVTASLGHHDAVANLLLNRLPASSVDFHDIHLYNDEGTIPLARLVRRYVETSGRPLVLGEFGQRADRIDDELQSTVTIGFIRSAHLNGLAGALAWRLSEWSTSGPSRFSYEGRGGLRPGADAFRRESRANLLDP